MKNCVLCLLFVCATASSVTPVQKVLEMMTQMKVKGVAMKETEVKVFAEYSEWVDDQTKERNFEIETAASNIEKLLAFINKADNDVTQLVDQIQELDTDISRMENEKKESTSTRDAQRKEFVAIQFDYAESVDALGRAIQTMKAQDYSRPQAEMLLQNMAKTQPGMQRVLAAFLQQGASQDGAPAVAAFTSQSGGIIDMLEGLETKFKKELDEVEEAESNEAHYYDLEMLHLSDTITKSKSDREEKSVTKARTMEASATAKGELTETKAAKAADEEYVRDMTATYEAKSSAYAANQEVRKNELEAISKAIEIISSPSVSDSYSQHINLAQVETGSATSFLQTRQASHRAALKAKAFDLLEQSAARSGSKILLALAAQVSGSPFEKVVGMIEDMIAKLKEEAAAEADHKAWCDEQLKKNKMKRNKKTSDTNKLSAQIEALAGQIAQMGEDIATLLTEQQELTKAMMEATEQRQTEKTKNKQVIADSLQGAAAVKAAIVVLREFYATQAGFLQVRRQVPEMAEYKGMGSAKTGVVGMLEVIQSDFVRMAAETKSAEVSAAQEYDEFMSDSKADAEAKHEEEVKLKLDKDQAEFDQSQLAKDLKLTQKELDKANEYFGYLKPNCLEVKVSFEDRAARRQEEIEALKEAYKILGEK